jgi:hypothetical protein
MRWPDLEKHERFGVATMDVFGLILNCNGSFAGHLGTDVSGASGTWFHDWISEPCKAKLDKRLDDLRECKVGCASFNVIMNHCDSLHAVEIVCYGKKGSEGLWVLSFSIPTDGASEAKEKLEVLNERILSYFMNGGPSHEVNINTTNITGEKNQSVQAENVKDASQDN